MSQNNSLFPEALYDRAEPTHLSERGRTEFISWYRGIREVECRADQAFL